MDSNEVPEMNGARKVEGEVRRVIDADLKRMGELLHRLLEAAEYPHGTIGTNQWVGEGIAIMDGRRKMLAEKLDNAGFPRLGLEKIGEDETTDSGDLPKKS